MHKPDTQTALTALWVRALAVEAGLPPDLWQVVLGDGPTIGAAVVDRGDYVCFTGSTRVGREVAERCGRRLVGCSLELGGKNPMLVLDGRRPGPRGRGRGARLLHQRRPAVHLHRADVRRRERARRLPRPLPRAGSGRCGWAPTSTTRSDMGSLISAAQLDRVTAHVDDAVAKGATVLAGGRARPDIGPLFYEPTVLTGVTEEMALCRDETFGPVVSVYAVRRRATRRSRWPTTRSTASTPASGPGTWRAAAQVAARIATGTVNVNEAYAAAWGATARADGRHEGLRARPPARREGLLKYTEAQTVAVQRLHRLRAAGAGLRSTRGPRGFTAALRALKALGRR